VNTPDSGPIGIFGGTFDPIHYGHLRTAFELWQTLKLAEVRFMPSGNPPHRVRTLADAALRVQMVRAAVADQPAFVVDDREVRRAGASYTVDTLTELRAEFPHRSLCLLLGMDAFLGLPGWHRWRELFDLAHLVVAVRPGHALDPLVPALQLATAARWTDDPILLEGTANGLLFLLDLPLRFEAASNVRERIAGRLPWEDEVPPAVAAYIHAQRLYGVADRGD